LGKLCYDDPMNAPDLQRASEKLQQGGIIAYPTEAVWGLGCDPGNYPAVKRILRLKNRSEAEGLILLAAGMDQLPALFATLNASQKARLASSWPGPTTWLIPDPDHLFPDWIKGQHQTVAIRVSAHPLVQALCSKFGGPIVSTSANRTGAKEIRSRAGLEEKFGDSIDYIVSGELGAAARTSEIRDLMSNRRIR
jgi:L-threonylcarbamoyladenylate synthase